MSFTAPLPSNNDEVDLRQVAASLGRQKALIGSITVFAALLSSIYAFTRKPVWEGSFQIVLENNNNTGGRLAALASGNPIIANLTSLGAQSSGSSLLTEVKILESPSVLKPVFDYVKSSKSNTGKDLSNFKITDWSDSVSISLIDGTSILDIAYRDENKDLILPVLQEISKTYQQYSGRDRQRGITQNFSYIEEQLKILQDQSDQSMRTAQAYALNNGLGIQDGMPTEAASTGTSVEGKREEAQQKVSTLRQQINAAKTVGGARLYKAPQLQANAALYGQLQAVEAVLKEKSALLTPRDQSILALQRQRSSLTAYINQQTIALLQGELLTAEAELASLTRPREVVLKHRELVRRALRDEKLLSDFESQLQSIKLEQARRTDPWELISTPTVLEKPVAPRKLRIAASGILGGLVVGLIAGLICDRRSGLVFSEDELKSLIPCPLLERLPLDSPERWSHTAQLLAEGPLSNAESLGLLVIGQILSEQIDQLSTSLRDALGNRTLVVSSDPLLTRHVDTQILVTASGVAQRHTLKQLREELALQGTPIVGWLLIDPQQEA